MSENLLAALFAPGAQAIEIAVDPGVVGETSIPMQFILDAPASVVDITFTDLKTLESGPGAVAFSLQLGGELPFVNYSGFFSDAAGEAIPGTQFSGIVDGDRVLTLFHGRFD